MVHEDQKTNSFIPPKPSPHQPTVQQEVDHTQCYVLSEVKLTGGYTTFYFYQNLCTKQTFTAVSPAHREYAQWTINGFSLGNDTVSF